MKILITGGAGFIGYHLASNLSLNNDNTIICIDNLSDYYSVNLKLERLKLLKNKANVRFLNQDILNINFEKEFDDLDLIIHLAAQPGVRLPPNKNYLYVENNIKTQLKLLEHVRTSNTKLIYASSSSVYGERGKKVLKENDVNTFPVSMYGLSKKFCEEMSLNYKANYLLNSVGLRFFTVYGSWGRPDMAVFKFTEAIKNNQEIIIYNSGNLYRDFTHISDIVLGIRSIIGKLKMDQNSYNIYNIGRGKPISVNQMLFTIEDKLKLKANVKYVEKKDEVKHTYACIENMNKEFSYFPKVDFKEGYDEFYDWYKYWKSDK